MTPLDRRTLFKLLGANLGAATLGETVMARKATASPSAAPSQITQNSPHPTATERIGEFVATARYEDLPAAVVEKAKEQIVYHFGLAFAGAFDDKAGHMRAVAAQLQQAGGGSTVIGERTRLLPSDAAFANCTLMRATWRDDVVWPAGIHAGIITLPTALALGEAVRSSGRDMLLALTLGYEVLGKLGRPVTGWAAPWPRRPTMIFGGYGPTTVGGKLLGFDAPAMANVLTYGTNLCMGVPEGGQMEHFYSFISRNGTFAVPLSATGPGDASRVGIEGPIGLYGTFFGKVPEELDDTIAGMGTDWEILTAEQKRHHGTGANAVAIQLLLDLMGDNELVADQVLKVVAFLPSQREARTEVAMRGPFSRWDDAYSSLPYALAVALIDGEVVPERYTDEVVNDPTVAREMDKVVLSYEDGHETNGRYCRVALHATDGRTLVGDSNAFVYPFPQNDWGEWLQKDGQRLLPLEQLRQLGALIADLENVDDVSALMATLVPPSSGAHAELSQDPFLSSSRLRPEHGSHSTV